MRKNTSRQNLENVFVAGLVLFLTSACRENINMFSSYQLRSALKQFEPVLAVRNTACINCHGKADNLITDFGKGTRDFFNHQTSGNHLNYESWSTSFYKSITVPVVPSSSSRLGINNNMTGSVAQSACEPGRHQEFYFQSVDDSTGAKAITIETGREYYIRSAFTDQYLLRNFPGAVSSNKAHGGEPKWKLEGNDSDGYQITSPQYYDDNTKTWKLGADFSSCLSMNKSETWEPVSVTTCNPATRNQRFAFVSSATPDSFQIKPLINTRNNYCLEIPGGDYIEPEKPIREFISKRAKVKNPDITVKVLKKDPFIGAPSRDQLLSYLKFGVSEGWFYRKSQIDSPDLNQNPTDLPNSQAYEISGSLTCDGDLAFSKPLALKNLSVHTKNGCRIYVVGPVFIEGSIEFSSLVSDQNKTNLQIVSSDVIFMGVGDTHCETEAAYGTYYITDLQNPSGAPSSPLWKRLVDRVQDLSSKDVPSRHSKAAELSAYYQKLKAMVQESGLQDASCRPGTTNVLKRALNFERLMLVAPLVHSRYLGDFKGLIVGEHVLLTLSQFRFEFSPVFLDHSVGLLPLIPSDSYLRIEE